MPTGRTDTITYLKLRYSQANDSIADAASWWWIANDWFMLNDEENALETLIESVEHLIESVVSLIGWGYFPDLGFGVPSFLDDYTIEEITWEDMTSAMANASKEGRWWLIMSIDELRREVWDFEFTSFRIRPATE